MIQTHTTWYDNLDILLLGGELLAERCHTCLSPWSMDNYLRQRRLCFHFGLFVRLSVGRLKKLRTDFDEISWRGRGQPRDQGPMSSILVTIWITVQIQESKVQNPHSLDCRKSYQRILMKFYGQLWCEPRDQLITLWWRSGSPSGSEVRNPDSLDYRSCWRSAEVCALWALLVWIWYSLITHSVLKTASPVVVSFLGTGSNLNCFFSCSRTGWALVATDNGTCRLVSTTGERSGRGSFGCNARRCKHYTSWQNVTM